MQWMSYLYVSILIGRRKHEVVMWVELYISHTVHVTTERSGYSFFPQILGTRKQIIMIINRHCLTSIPALTRTDTNTLIICQPYPTIQIKLPMTYFFPNTIQLRSIYEMAFYSHMEKF